MPGEAGAAAGADYASSAASLAALTAATVANRAEATLVSIFNMNSNLNTQTGNSLVSLSVKSFEAIGAATR